MKDIKKSNFKVYNILNTSDKEQDLYTLFQSALKREL